MRILPDATPEVEAALFPAHPILVTYRGSIVHGTHVLAEDGGIDDVDLLCVYIPDLRNYFGIRGADLGVGRGKDIRHGKWDCAAYELTHFARLLSAANPNVLSSLWVEPEHILYTTPEAEMLIKARELFSSQRARASFTGYAFSQLKRMTAFYDEGEDRCCKGEKFHSDNCPLREVKGRGSAKKFATGFMGAKRKALVEEFGYDTKNAAHLLRLLAMGKEFLLSGILYPDRTEIDAAFLKDVKAGKFDLMEVQRWAEEMFEGLKVESSLPEQPDWQGIDELLTNILSRRFNTEIALRTVEGLK